MAAVVTPEKRQALRLLSLEKLTYKQIADILDIAESTVARFLREDRITRKDKIRISAKEKAERVTELALQGYNVQEIVDLTGFKECLIYIYLRNAGIKKVYNKV